MQVLAGPRQVGKTTLARQVLAALDIPNQYASADDPSGRDRAWLEAQWDIGRIRAQEGGRRGGVLVLDEIQKIGSWSEIVKRLWDEDSASASRLRVVLLGSAPLLVQRGLTESLAGRFEMIRASHWSFDEMRDAFGWTLDRYMYFGGYPGAAALVRDRTRWAAYVLDSLIETTISRDVLSVARIDKPALLRQLLRLACDYSGRVLSYQKMLGQLQDAGNTTTLAHYLELLSGAGLVTGLQKFSGSRVRQRGSIPKLVALNSALVTAQAGVGERAARSDAELWGRVVETAAGAFLVNSTRGSDVDVFYWRERNHEVDFVLSRGAKTVAIEITSGRRKDSLPGMSAFSRTYPTARKLLVGGQGILLDEFLTTPVEKWL